MNDESWSDHEYAKWDAAYVLGALSVTDRRDFEMHLENCPSCRAAVGELSGMPALLSRLDRDELAVIDEANGTGDRQSPPPDLLPSLLVEVRRRRRRSRLMAWTAAAVAAVALTIGVLVGVAGHSFTGVPARPPAPVPALPMVQVGTSRLASTVSLRSQQWGTLITMQCVCLAPLNARHDTLALVVVTRDGSRARLATWVASPGHTATPTGSVATPIDQIASVQVVSADSGDVLLQRSL
jgi:anti-sigma factor RsiW